MVCPFCLHKKTEVYNSRPTKKVNSLWRRRRCLACKKEFTTREIIDAEAILRVKITARKSEPFSRARLLLSVLRACDHQQTRENAYWLCQTIEQKLIQHAASKNGIVTPEDIIETTLATLKPFDTPAFIKYLSYHSPSILDTKTVKQRLKRDAK